MKSSKWVFFSRLGGWFRDEEPELDREMQDSLTGEGYHSRRLTRPEWYAEEEKYQEEKNARLISEEKEDYRKLHAWNEQKGLPVITWIYRGLAVLVLVVLLVMLLRTTAALPAIGNADNPANNEVSERYLEKGIEETGAVNFVAGMILDYRAFDTFGESTVLFCAACTVLILLKLREKEEGEKPSAAMLEAEFDDRHYEPKNDSILQTAARLLVPIIMLYGFYVVLNGHLSPGGGFSGGAIMGAGLILYLNAFGFKKTERFFTYKVFRWITFLALMTYALLKSYSFFTGANGLESGIGLGTPGSLFSSGLILPLNICVGLIVMSTMYAFYALFRKGDM